MDVRQLRYFLAVAEELSFSAAARRLNISQPPLSMQIKALEAGLGTLLFDRDRHSVALTAAGEVLLRQARETLAQLDRAEALVRRAGQGEAGRLVLAFTSSVPLLPLFATTIRTFRARYPDTEVEVRGLSTGAQLAALAERQIDLGMLRPPHWFRPPASLSVRRLWRDELHVFLPGNHRLAAGNGPVPPELLAGESFISFPPEAGCGLAEHMFMLCSQAGFSPRVTHQVPVASAVLGLVAAGMGIAILPECQSRAGIVGVASRPLDAPDTGSDLLLAHRVDDANPLLHRFLDVAAAVAPAPSSEAA